MTEPIVKPDTAPPATVWARIKAHKVLQWSLAYLGAALAVAHGQEILGHTCHWPYLVERILIGGLIVGLPIAPESDAGGRGQMPRRRRSPSLGCAHC